MWSKTSIIARQWKLGPEEGWGFSVLHLARLSTTYFTWKALSSILTCDWLRELNPWPCDPWPLQRLIQSIWEAPDCDQPWPFSRLSQTHVHRCNSVGGTINHGIYMQLHIFMFVCAIFVHVCCLLASLLVTDLTQLTLSPWTELIRLSCYNNTITKFIYLVCWHQKCCAV